MNNVKADPAAKPAHLILRGLELPSPFEAFVLPATKFPVPEREYSAIRGFLNKFMAMLTARWKLSLEVFIQLEQFDDQAARDAFRPHAASWIPEVGLGVWPDRDPPAIWTQDEFMEATAEGKRPRPLMYQVFRITASKKARSHAHEVLLPFGSLVEFMTRKDFEALAAQAEEVLLPTIQDPSFTCFPFYVPLLEAKTLTSGSVRQLEAWFCGASVYIRESFEDNGILIAASEPLTPVLEELGGRFEGSPERVWRVPC